MNPRITIAVNTYGQETRHQVAKDSWKYLTYKYDNVTLKDYQFDALSSSMNDGIGNKELPYITSILDAASKDSEYIIYCNNDIILSDKIIKRIHEEKPKVGFACSRMDIKPVDSFDDFKANVVPIRWEIAGFDAFVINSKWYDFNKDLFQPYLIGMPYWDQVYATILKIYGGDEFGNKYIPCCFHVKHPETWQNEKCNEKQWNRNLCIDTPLDWLCLRLFDKYLRSTLIKRYPFGSFLKISDSEFREEVEFFDTFNHLKNTPLI